MIWGQTICRKKYSYVVLFFLLVICILKFILLDNFALNLVKTNVENGNLHGWQKNKIASYLVSYHYDNLNDAILQKGTINAKTNEDARSCIILLGWQERINSIEWMRSYDSGDNKLNAITRRVVYGLENGVQMKNKSISDYIDFILNMDMMISQKNEVILSE